MAEIETGNHTEKGTAIWGRVLTVVLVLIIVASVSALFYSIASPVKEPFTEFYILGLGGKAESYPTEIRAGEEAEVLVGIHNVEYRTARYRLVVRVNGLIYSEEEPITLEHDEKWEGHTGFVINTPGDNQKVEFLLYYMESDTDYKSLYLLLSVK